MIPTAEQVFQCFILGYWLTKMYVSVNLVRIDERTSKVLILAGEDIEIEIEPTGAWSR